MPGCRQRGAERGASGRGQVANFMHSIGEYATTKGITYRYAVGAHPNKKHHDFLVYPFSFLRLLSKALSRLTGNFDYHFKIGTKRLIRWIDKENPDLVHIHNLHGDYINLEMLIHYLKVKKIPVVFSLHDTWLFTGKCFDYENDECLRWKKLCKKCPQKKRYPAWLFGDASTKNFLRKKALFSNFDSAIYVTNFEWLRSQLSKTLLKAKNAYCIYNGIDTTKFSSNSKIIRKEFHIPENKRIILCYADKWENNSLLTVQQLTEIMGNDYQIIILNAPKKYVTKKAIVIPKMKNKSLITDCFAAASIFINFSVNNVFPMENLYAFASGTPVFAFAFGGTPEQMNDFVGRIIPDYDPIRIKKEIIDFLNRHSNYELDCQKRAEEFSILKTVKQYYEVYDNILKKKS